MSENLTLVTNYLGEELCVQMLKTSWECVPQNLHEKNCFYNSYILLNFPYHTALFIQPTYQFI